MFLKSIVTLSILLLNLAIYEFIIGYMRQKDRYYIYKLAESRAKKLNKKLIVFGDPYSGKGSKIYNKFMNTYGCGDIVVDIKLSKKYDNCIEMDMLSYLKTCDDNSNVVFISCVLEYVDNLDEIIGELLRVTGSYDNIYVVTVSKYSIFAYLYQDQDHHAKQIVRAPPKHDCIVYTKNFMCGKK
jgi:hypothetical protein